MSDAVNRQMEISCTVNGDQMRLRAYPMARLLDVLRENLHLTGTKEGCGEGECGACSILLDGALVNSCLVPALQADGSDHSHHRRRSNRGATCTPCKELSWNAGELNAASARREWYWQPWRCSSETHTRMRCRFAPDSPAISAAVLATGKSLNLFCARAKSEQKGPVQKH